MYDVPHAVEVLCCGRLIMEGGGTHVHVVIVVVVDDYYGNEGGVRRSDSIAIAKVQAEETSRCSPWPWPVRFLMAGWRRCVE